MALWVTTRNKFAEAGFASKIHDFRDVKRGHWARVYANDSFINIMARSGFHTGDVIDFASCCEYLPINASDEELAQSARSALAASRFVTQERRDDILFPSDIEFDYDLFDQNAPVDQYKKWVQDTMKRYGFKTKQALFNGMKLCDITMKDGRIVFFPRNHCRLDAWDSGNLTEKDNVVISDNSSLAETGAALRLALSRCT